MKHEVITAVNESDAVEKGAGQLLTCLKSSVADIFLRGCTGPVVVVMNKTFVNIDGTIVSLSFV